MLVDSLSDRNLGGSMFDLEKHIDAVGSVMEERDNLLARVKELEQKLANAESANKALRAIMARVADTLMSS